MATTVQEKCKEHTRCEVCTHELLIALRELSDGEMIYPLNPVVSRAFQHGWFNGAVEEAIDLFRDAGYIADRRHSTGELIVRPADSVV